MMIDSIKKTITSSRNLLIFSILLLLVLLGWLLIPSRKEITFEGEKAYLTAQRQISFGPRIPGSKAHEQFLIWAESDLILNGWKVSRQEGVIKGQSVKNIIAKKGTTGQLVILGAHYDSRMIADNDPGTPGVNVPVPGANDGASGVAVLLELSRTLELAENRQVWLVFFDGEDQGDLSGWDWILGSSYFADNLGEIPDAVVIVDMVGDSELTLPRETNSDPFIQDMVWKTAQSLGYGGIFVDRHGYSMLDDHTPFLEKGIPAIDIIDFDYPYWHTSDDDLQKISPASLEAVGRTLEVWLEGKTLLGSNEHSE